MKEHFISIIIAIILVAFIVLIINLSYYVDKLNNEVCCLREVVNNQGEALISINTGYKRLKDLLIEADIIHQHNLSKDQYQLFLKQKETK